ncbi:MAG TPA: ATP phosphoribosyltransferase regulatory subunit [Pyrinomonadaceae bacterium]|nr:ATP phosphoribosyltransferase regulatory subunit [Pyrinomonadaceae bacterium]
MNEPLSKVPGGMRYHFGAEARLRRAVEDTVMRVFDGWSYEEIATPSVDYYALFERGMGRDEAQRAFRFTDADGRTLALRPDVTSSVARAAATLFAGRARPLRFCYAATVFRQRPRSHAEWRRQSRQLGCELIGAHGGAADLETLIIASEVLESLGLGGSYRVTLNHVGIFNGVAAELGLDAASRDLMRSLIDTRDSAELGRFLAARAAGSGDRAEALTSCLTSLSGKRETLDEARTLMPAARAVEALDALAETWRVLDALGLERGFEIDFGDVAGLDYYTGLIFKIYVAGAGARVGGGGRYDELTANFGAREPAVGFVLDLDALTEVLSRGRRFAVFGDADMETPAIEGTTTRELFLEARRRRSSGERLRVGLKREGD